MTFVYLIIELCGINMGSVSEKLLHLLFSFRCFCLLWVWHLRLRCKTIWSTVWGNQLLSQTVHWCVSIKNVSLCHSWTSCSKLFWQFVRFWIFWSWIRIININLSLECCWDTMLCKANDVCVCWSDDDVAALFWVLMLLALFPYDCFRFWDKILLYWFIWFVVILPARVVSDTCLILPCSNSNCDNSKLFPFPLSSWFIVIPLCHTG